MFMPRIPKTDIIEDIKLFVAVFCIVMSTICVYETIYSLGFILIGWITMQIKSKGDK